MFNLNCKTIPVTDMRYNTIGDYWTEGGCTQYRIASMGNSDYEFLVFVHEVIEKQIAKKMGISEHVIDTWDLLHEDADEPGAMPNCPYREAHEIAEGFERALAVKLGVDWDHYDRVVKEILATPQPAPDKGPSRPKAPNHVIKSRGKVRKRSVLNGT